MSFLQSSQEVLPRPLAASLLAIALLAVPGGLVSCGDGGSGAATSTAGSTAGSAATGDTKAKGVAAPFPGATRRGFLEILDPQDPERPGYHNLGDLNYGEVRRWDVHLQNTGEEPTRLRTAQAACGCTRVSELRVKGPNDDAPEIITRFEQGDLCEVPPGGLLQVSIQVLTKYSTANQRKLALVRLTTDSELIPFITLEVNFLAKRAFTFAPKEARLLNVPTSHGGEARIKVLTQAAGDPGRVLGIESFPEGIEAEFTAETFAGEFVWWIDVKVPPMSPLGVTRGEIVLRTTDPDGEGDAGRLSLPVIAQVVPDAVLDAPLASLGAFKSTVGATFEGQLTALVPGAKLKVMASRFDAVTGAPESLLSLVCEPVDADDSGRAKAWTVRVTAEPGIPAGFVSGDIVFEVDEPLGGMRDPERSKELRVRLSGRITEG